MLTVHFQDIPRRGSSEEYILQDLRAHSYEVAKDVVARESSNAGANFSSNADVQSALKHVSQASRKS